MASPLERLNKFMAAMEALMRSGGTPRIMGRRVLSLLGTSFSSDAVALAAWEQGYELKISATQGLSKAQAAKLRQIMTLLPSIPQGILQGLKKRKKQKASLMVEACQQLEILLEELQGPFANLEIWPLAWAGGEGLVIMGFQNDPRISPALAKASASYLGMVLAALLLRVRAQYRQEDYKRIFANSKDMIYLSSRDGRWVDVNQAGVEMLGYESREELLALPDIGKESYLRPRDRLAFRKAIEKEGYVKDYEVAFKKKDGSAVEVSITAQVRMKDGRITGYEGIIKDITERKRQQEREERQHKLIESILELVPVALFVVDREHKVLYWNQACEKLTGTTRQKIVGTNKVWKVFKRPVGVSLADVVLEGDAEKMEKVYGAGRLRKSALSSEAWEAEAHFDNLGGRPKDLIFSAATLRDQRGEIVGAVEAILDSTQIKDLERNLTESEKLYRTLVESNREGIALNDGERFVVANQAFLEMFGLEDLNKAQGHFMDLVDSASRLDFLAWRKGLKTSGMISSIYEGHGIRKGERFDMEVNAAWVPHQGKKAILYTIRDVSYRKQMEEQLIRSERLAATGKLAFDIAHEVNTPLGGIITYAYLLNEDLAGDNEKTTTVEKIIQLANRCKIIIRGLLDFARQEREENTLLDMNQVIREMLSLIEGHLILRNLELELRLKDQLPLVQGNRTKLEQVFLNLVINAAESMEGKGKLEIRTCHDQKAKEVKVEVRDQGPGITEEVALRIFEPFYTTKSRGRGTGLGLSISHGIIKAHQGRLEVTSKVGKGSVFTVSLPIAAPLLQEEI